MGEVAPIRRGWEAPQESVTADGPPLPFESFFENEKDHLPRALYLITGSAGEAEDLTQEAFTRLYERWDSVSTMDDPAGYIGSTRVGR